MRDATWSGRNSGTCPSGELLRANVHPFYRNRIEVIYPLPNKLFCRYDERDVFISREQLQDLRERLGITKFENVYLPQVFIHGKLLGVSELHPGKYMINIDQNLGHLSN